MIEKKGLFSEFPPVSYDEWIEKIREDLKGADFGKRLVWKPFNDFEANPFYRKEDIDSLVFTGALPGENPYVRGVRTAKNKWRIRQDIVAKDFIAANSKARKMLSSGADSAGFILPDPEKVSTENVSYLLEGIDPGSYELNFLCPGKAKEIVNILSGWIQSSGFSSSSLNGAIETDPLGRLARNGSLCVSPMEGFDYLFELVNMMEELPSFRAVHINASIFGNAGADPVSEMALSLSMGAEYMAQLTSRGLDPAVAARKLRFGFGTGSLYFIEIARLRAARLLWTAVLDGYGLSGNRECAMSVHSTTTRWNKTVYDPYVNLLRTQTEAMSAIIGGADSVTVEPFDVVFREPDEFSERLARNQQLILKEEAFFERVADPAGGSYYIEKLTDIIASRAWSVFVSIEEEGGFLEALIKGHVKERVEKAANSSKEDISQRKKVFVGTSRYPGNDVHDSDTYISPDYLSAKADNNPAICEPIRQERGAEGFERIRILSDLAPKRPSVFLLQSGDQKMRSARAGFTADFFGCAGYKIINEHPFDDINEGIAQAIRSSAPIVVLCSSDQEYANLAPHVFNQLKDKALVVIAGNPECSGDLRKAGLEFFISLKSDVVKTLEELNKKIGIKG